MPMAYAIHPIDDYCSTHTSIKGSIMFYLILGSKVIFRSKDRSTLEYKMFQMKRNSYDNCDTLRITTSKPTTVKPKYHKVLSYNDPVEEQL